MLRKYVAALVVLTVAITLAPPPAAAQSGDRTMPMRTPDGQPDVSGTFTFRTLTPFQRPARFEGRERLDPEEAAAFEASERVRLNRDLFDPERGAAGYRPRSEGGVLSYNEFWYERGIELTSDKRTSLIVDPPDGRLPPMTEAAVQAAAERRAYREVHRYDSYENRSLADRCIMGFNSGPPMRSERLQQQRDDLPDAGPRDHSQRDGAQRPGHTDRQRHREARRSRSSPACPGRTGKGRPWSSRPRSSGAARAAARDPTCT